MSRHRRARPRLDERVGVRELPAQQVGKEPANGGLSRAHEADEDDAVRHRRSRVLPGKEPVQHPAELGHAPRVADDRLQVAGRLAGIKTLSLHPVENNPAAPREGKDGGRVKELPCAVPRPLQRRAGPENQEYRETSRWKLPGWAPSLFQVFRRCRSRAARHRQLKSPRSG